MSIWHWIIVLAVGLLLFGGRGKISELMGDFAKGIKSFKKGLSEDDNKTEGQPAADPVKTINHQSAPPTAPSSAPTSAPATSGTQVPGTEPRKV
jgi:sec-independent protein translocase protein TatA